MAYAHAGLFCNSYIIFYNTFIFVNFSERIFKENIWLRMQITNSFKFPLLLETERRAKVKIERKVKGRAKEVAETV